MKKIFIALGVIAFIGMVVAVSSLFLADESLTHDGHIPDTIGAFYLTNKIEGEEAKQIMNQLHGDEVDLDEAYVLEYQTQKGSYAIVWISETNLAELPPKLFEDMLEFVENSELYTNHHEKEISNRNVQYAFGTERDNYYFATENRFVWVATFEDKRDIFIKNAVKIF